MDQPVSGYRLLRIAAEHFGTAPTQLDAQQRQEATRIARNEQQIEQLVLTSPEARQVSVPDSQVEHALEQIRGRYPSDAEFEQALEDMGVARTSMVQALARELRVEAVMELVASRVPPVNETEAGLYYYMHPEKFEQPERRAARHILITVNDDLEGSDSASALAHAQEIAKRLQKDPRRFADQALKHSECPSSLNGGVLGEVHRGVLYPQLDEVLFAMQAGEVSDPVATELGWHVLSCDSISDAGTVSRAQALPKLMEALQAREVRQAQRQWLAERQRSVNAASSTDEERS